MTISDRYTGGRYAADNPDWHVGDSPWKATQLLNVLGGSQVRTVCEVGCGAGEILRQMHDRTPGIDRLVGYEMAEPPFKMSIERATDRLTFKLQDAADDDEVFDLMLIVDVIEHVPDPVSFLSRIRFKAARTLLHVPLELSVNSMLRPSQLTQPREHVGHIHHFTPETAIATVQDAGYVVRGHTFTQSFQLYEPGSLKARVLRLPRQLLPVGWTVRLLGGCSILIDASNS